MKSLSPHSMLRVIGSLFKIPFEIVTCTIVIGHTATVSFNLIHLFCQNVTLF